MIPWQATNKHYMYCSLEVWRVAFKRFRKIIKDLKSFVLGIIQNNNKVSFPYIYFFSSKINSLFCCLIFKSMVSGNNCGQKCNLTLINMLF